MKATKHARGGGGGRGGKKVKPPIPIRSRKISLKRERPATTVKGLDDEEWNFSTIQDTDLEAAVTFEYLRESKTLRRYLENHRHDVQGFMARLPSPQTISDLKGELPQSCANWTYLQDHPKTLDLPWLRLEGRIRIELRKLWRTRPCKILSWYSLATIMGKFTRSTLEDWPGTNIDSDARLELLRDEMQKDPSLHVMSDHQEVVAFQFDWTRFTEDEIAEDMARQFKAVFTRPKGLRASSQKPADHRVSLRNLAIARLRKAGVIHNAKIQIFAKSAGFNFLAGTTNASFRNHRRDLCRTFYRLHPYLKKGGKACPEKAELPSCLGE